jgi:hypothetical protein
VSEEKEFTATVNISVPASTGVQEETDNWSSCWPVSQKITIALTLCGRQAGKKFSSQDGKGF